MNPSTLPWIVLAIWLSFAAVIVFSVVQCSTPYEIAEQHEDAILDICLNVERSDMIDCIKREWDKVNDK